MNLLAKVGWTALTLLLSAVLVGAASSPALAEGRGNSGLPSGPGNPVAKLQQEINALTQRFAELAQLGQSVAALKQQIDALQKQITTLQQQGAAIDTLQQQMTTLQRQVAGYSNLQQQINALNSQVGSLNTQVATVRSPCTTPTGTRSAMSSAFRTRSRG